MHWTEHNMNTSQGEQRETMIKREQHKHEQERRPSRRRRPQHIMLADPSMPTTEPQQRQEVHPQQHPQHHPQHPAAAASSSFHELRTPPRHHQHTSSSTDGTTDDPPSLIPESNSCITDDHSTPSPSPPTTTKMMVDATPTRMDHNRIQRKLLFEQQMRFLRYQLEEMEGSEDGCREGEEEDGNDGDGDDDDDRSISSHSELTEEERSQWTLQTFLNYQLNNATTNGGSRRSTHGSGSRRQLLSLASVPSNSPSALFQEEDEDDDDEGATSWRRRMSTGDYSHLTLDTFANHLDGIKRCSRGSGDGGAGLFLSLASAHSNNSPMNSPVEKVDEAEEEEEEEVVSSKSAAEDEEEINVEAAAPAVASDRAVTRSKYSGPQEAMV
mmetsp:Transcript_37553/g.63974  ORF Transcript_37553/g.63974 Transcript_37553/m.63974 type:complete len:383 (+) Transcript_37553:246-1394(+)